MRSDYGLLPGAIVTMRTFVITVTAVGREPVQTGLGGGAYLMLAKAEEYRAMAITCERLAKKTRDPSARVFWCAVHENGERLKMRRAEQ